ncbi:MAG: Uma2 family endonuclease [SAR324 cluster bacterium]|nr:Uma2 family endonuclease [SAR324 cluster bacterium]
MVNRAPTTKKSVYLAWEENHQLDLVMEFSSFSTRRVDHHKKKQIYEQVLKVPYYIIFDPHAIYLNVYALKEGMYQSQEANEQGYWCLEELKIQVGIENSNTLRLFDTEGNLIPSSAEKEAQRAEKEAQRAEKEAQRAEKEAQRAEKEAQRAKKLEERIQQITQQAEKEKQALLEEMATLRKQ